jgi:hypothetical protein
MCKMLGYDVQETFIGPLDPRTLLLATSNYGGCVKEQVYQPPMSQSLLERTSGAIAKEDESLLGRT